MIRPNLFPPDVRVLQGDPRIIKGELYPAEQELIASACIGRQREFRAGRLLARALLYEMGIAHFPLLTGGNREPLWPAAAIGSITHLSNICIVAVTSRNETCGLGIDVARIYEVNSNIWPTFMTPGERQWIKSLPEPVAQRYAAMIFSAKETLFKCLFPIARVWIDFKDVRISTEASYRIYRRGRFTQLDEQPDPTDPVANFEASFVVAKGGIIPQGFTINGGYYFDGPYVYTAMTLSHQQVPLSKPVLHDAAPTGEQTV